MIVADWDVGVKGISTICRENFAIQMVLFQTNKGLYVETCSIRLFKCVKADVVWVLYSANGFGIYAKIIKIFPSDL